ncbi:MAG: CoA-binding protein [Geobacteraceae bacterium]|nr:CoA-binding protein [Geobacteraceae bacterium]
MRIEERIEQFLAEKKFAVVGASIDRSKYGNKVLRCYQINRYNVIPVNPKEAVVEGVDTVASVAQLPDDVKSISVITPPHVTEMVVEEAIAKGIKNIWMQPGAESESAIKRCIDSGINVIADGSCILVVLGYRDH